MTAPLILLQEAVRCDCSLNTATVRCDCSLKTATVKCDCSLNTVAVRCDCSFNTAMVRCDCFLNTATVRCDCSPWWTYTTVVLLSCLCELEPWLNPVTCISDKHRAKMSSSGNIKLVEDTRDNLPASSMPTPHAWLQHRRVDACLGLVKLRKSKDFILKKQIFFNFLSCSYKSVYY